MTSIKRLVLAALVTSGAFLAGCSSPSDSSIPWSRPAGWEGGIPGMGGLGGPGGYR
jgi:hypothetical protein